MRNSTTEMSDPTKWLDHLESRQDGMTRFVEESGDLGLAAFRVARARNHGRQPSRSAITNVARELAVRTGYFDVLPGEGAFADITGAPRGG